MSEWKSKRFWTAASAVPIEGGYGVQLDGRDVRTPAKNILVLPCLPIAQAIAEEWQAQKTHVDPGTMPLTRLANSAQEKVARQHQAVADFLVEYGGSDLLCYRAHEPEGLVARQAETWDPILDWAEATHGIPLARQSGVMPAAQPDASLARMTKLTRALDPFALTAFHELVTLSGSWVLGFAALEGAQPHESLWAAAVLDDVWQEETWGADDEAVAARARKRAEFDTGLKFFHMTRST